MISTLHNGKIIVLDLSVQCTWGAFESKYPDDVSMCTKYSRVGCKTTDKHAAHTLGRPEEGTHWSVTLRPYKVGMTDRRGIVPPMVKIVHLLHTKNCARFGVNFSIFLLFQVKRPDEMNIKHVYL